MLSLNMMGEFEPIYCIKMLINFPVFTSSVFFFNFLFLLECSFCSMSNEEYFL